MISNVCLWFVCAQEEKMPYTFYIENKELNEALGVYAEKNKS